MKLGFNKSIAMKFGFHTAAISVFSISLLYFVFSHHAADVIDGGISLPGAAPTAGKNCHSKDHMIITIKLHPRSGAPFTSYSLKDSSYTQKNPGRAALPLVLPPVIAKDMENTIVIRTFPDHSVAENINNNSRVDVMLNITYEEHAASGGGGFLQISIEEGHVKSVDSHDDSADDWDQTIKVRADIITPKTRIYSYSETQVMAMECTKSRASNGVCWDTSSRDLPLRESSEAIHSAASWHVEFNNWKADEAEISIGIMPTDSRI